MSIEPVIFTDTDLCQIVFDVIELALHVTSEGAEKLLPHPPRSTHHNKKKESFKFKLVSEKRPHIHQDLMNNVGEVTENDQGYVKVRGGSKDGKYFIDYKLFFYGLGICRGSITAFVTSFQ
jgi:hypothetical protein